MNIRDFSLNLQKVYDEMALVFTGYQKSTGLNCLNGCGKCCTNPEIEASLWEMMPMALKIYDENKLDQWLELLQNPHSNICLQYQAHSPDGSKGMCGSYQERPSLCRMFGVGGYFDKHHEATLSICKLIRENQPELTQVRLLEVTSENTPMLANWAMQLSQLSPELTQDRKPLNLALKDALEKLSLYAQYHGPF
jgi:Fe-S-cluster containining protein